jgi:hypothetical protein
MERLLLLLPLRFLLLLALEGRRLDRRLLDLLLPLLLTVRLPDDLWLREDF